MGPDAKYFSCKTSPILTRDRENLHQAGSAEWGRAAGQRGRSGAARKARRKLCRVTGLGLGRHKASTRRSFIIKSARSRLRAPLKPYKRQMRRGEDGAGGLQAGCAEGRAAGPD